ncbi:hypothetical protein ACUXK4_004549 [Methylorubrum extorquens]
MRTVNLNIDDGLALSNVQPDASTGIATLEGVEGGYVRWVHVMAANEHTVPLAYETTAEDALRLAAAIIEWDAGMMERADDPFHTKWSNLGPRQTIRHFLPKMHPCEFREMFADTYDLQGEVR